MGLDMYAYALKEKGLRPKDIINFDSLYNKDFQYWRKHWCLNDWFRDLARRKGPEFFFNNDIGNTIFMELNKKDLKDLKKAIKGDYINYSNSFWSSGSKKDNKELKKRDLKFIDKALELIDKGYTIYYNDSW